MALLIRSLLSRYKVYLPLIISNYLLGKYGSIPRIKFIILSRSRTGSTMLINHLMRIPDSYVQSELMGRKFLIPFWKKIPCMIYGKHLKKYRLAGFKYFYYHPIDDWDSNDYIFDYIFSNPEIKVIHWIREDLFAVILSRHIAIHTGKWAKTKNDSPIENFIINENIFKIELEKTLSYISVVRNIFSSYENYIEISYEDVVERDGLDRILGFLGFSDFKLSHESKSSQRSQEKYQFIDNINKLREIYYNRMADFSRLGDLPLI